MVIIIQENALGIHGAVRIVNARRFAFNVHSDAVFLTIKHKRLPETRKLKVRADKITEIKST